MCSSIHTNACIEGVTRVMCLKPNALLQPRANKPPPRLIRWSKDWQRLTSNTTLCKKSSSIHMNSFIHLRSKFIMGLWCQCNQGLCSKANPMRYVDLKWSLFFLEIYIWLVYNKACNYERTPNTHATMRLDYVLRTCHSFGFDNKIHNWEGLCDWLRWKLNLRIDML